MGRPGRPPVAVPARLDGRLGAVLRGAVPDRGAGAQQRPATVDPGRLRLRPGRPADHHGSARRPHRPPQAAAVRRPPLRTRLRGRRLRAERRNAHRRTGVARHRRRDPDAVHARADPQPLPRRQAARQGGRDLVNGGDRRHRHRSGAQRGAAGALLVGFGVPGQRSGDGAAAGLRAAAAAGVQEPGGRTLRSAGLAAVPARDAAGGLRGQGDRPRRPGGVARPRPRGRPAGRRGLCVPPAHRPPPDARPGAVPAPRVQRLGADEPAGDVRDRRLCGVLHPVPPVRTGHEPHGGGAVEPAADPRGGRDGAGGHRARPADGPGVCHRHGVRHRGRRFRVALPAGTGLGPVVRPGGLGGLRLGPGHGDVARQRTGHRSRAARAGGLRLGRAGVRH